MKFVANGVTKCAPRLGVIKDVEGRPDYQFETPFPMLYTKGGNIPHITHEILKLVTKQPQVIQIPIASTHHFMEPMADFPGSISKFVGMPDCLTCVAVQDPGDLTLPGHHHKDHIPIWTRAGKVLLNSEVYMDAVESFKPDMYYLLSDADTNATSANKRLSKSLENTLNFFNKCLERHKSSQVLHNSFVMASIVGGYSTKVREKCLDHILKEKDVINGYLIDGLHNNGPEVEFIKFEEIKSVVEGVVLSLPEDKLRAVHGCWNPAVVLRLVQTGFDLFDTSYSHVATERSAALTFSLDVNETEDRVFEINMRDAKHQHDFRPILQGCTCLTCTKHSRGYINHLVTVQELLGPLLLTIHNVHHYLKFFDRIRECIREGSLGEYADVVSKEYNDFQRENVGGKGSERSAREGDVRERNVNERNVVVEV